MNLNRTMFSFQSLRFRMGRRLFAAVLAAVFLWIAGCTRPSVPIASVETPATPVEARRGMVVSAKIEASEAGVEVLRQGGNAVDAAVATGFALAVTYPPAGNVGGGGFMVIRFADGDKDEQSPAPEVTTIDYREKAPAAAHRDMYLDDEGQAIPQLSRLGYLASRRAGLSGGTGHGAREVWTIALVGGDGSGDSPCGGRVSVEPAGCGGTECAARRLCTVRKHREVFHEIRPE